MPPCQREHQCHRTIRPHATGAPISPHAICARASGSTDFTVLNAPVLAGAPISQLHQEHQFRHAICARASGSTNFIVSPFYEAHHFRHAICAPAGTPQFICASGRTNFTILAGPPVSPCYMRPRSWEHQQMRNYTFVKSENPRKSPHSDIRNLENQEMRKSENQKQNYNQTTSIA